MLGTALEDGEADGTPVFLGTFVVFFGALVRFGFLVGPGVGNNTLGDEEGAWSSPSVFFGAFVFLGALVRFGAFDGEGPRRDGACVRIGGGDGAIQRSSCSPMSRSIALLWHSLAPPHGEDDRLSPLLGHSKYSSKQLSIESPLSANIRARSSGLSLSPLSGP